MTFTNFIIIILRSRQSIGRDEERMAKKTKRELDSGYNQNQSKPAIHRTLRGFDWARHVKRFSAEWYDHAKSWLCTKKNLRVVHYHRITAENLTNGISNMLYLFWGFF